MSTLESGHIEVHQIPSAEVRINVGRGIGARILDRLGVDKQPFETPGLLRPDAAQAAQVYAQAGANIGPLSDDQQARVIALESQGIK